MPLICGEIAHLLIIIVVTNHGPNIYNIGEGQALPVIWRCLGSNIAIAFWCRHNGSAQSPDFYSILASWMVGRFVRKVGRSGKKSRFMSTDYRLGEDMYKIKEKIKCLQHGLVSFLLFINFKWYSNFKFTIFLLLVSIKFKVICL